MIKLDEITVHKYKCVENQVLKLDENVTVLVGMNESGKTALLESIAKTNYHTDDKDFTFNRSQDFPRDQLNAAKKRDEYPKAITCKYKISEELKDLINEDLGIQIFTAQNFEVTTSYENSKTVTLADIDKEKFFKFKLKELNIHSETLLKKIIEINNTEELNALKEEYSADEKVTGIGELEKYFKNPNNWPNPIWYYVYSEFLYTNLPKFLYYDEYYSLPSSVELERINDEEDDADKNDSKKTVRALLEIAAIDVDELLVAENFEEYKATLESTEAQISKMLFKYWSTNENIRIHFDVEKEEETDANENRRIVRHFLKIRVKNLRNNVSLPLGNRSKGFNWFFSFLIWFKKIQEEQDQNYVLLLDEPGLNLHASAQGDLLEFIEDLSKDYQIVYTTHSPFMIESEKMDRIRTVIETEKGTLVSENIEKSDKRTIFPLQAALGYNIAQNLFISDKNLLVEGVSDLIFLKVMSGLLQGNGMIGLSEDITIVPVGGLDKISTFVSLLRGNKLNMACLLDRDKKGNSKANLDNLIKEKLIKESKLLFYSDFLKNKHASVEDLFTKNEYIELYNKSFNETLKKEDLNDKIESIIIQINEYKKVDRFNHYQPANYLATMPDKEKFLSKETLGLFEEVFKKVNGKI